MDRQWSSRRTLNSGPPPTPRWRSRGLRVEARGSRAPPGRHVTDDGVEQRLNADRVQSPTCRGAGTACLRGWRCEARTSCSCVSVPSAKKVSISCLVGLGHHLNELFAGLLRLIGQVGGNLAFRHPAAVIGSKRQRLHAHQVDDAGEACSSPIGAESGRSRGRSRGAATRACGPGWRGRVRAG